jgi:hypothetical protein
MLRMRAKGLVRLLTATQIFLLVGSLFLPALASAATIQTDLFIYQDGDTVTVSGVEFGANEVVDFVTTDPSGTIVDSGSATGDDTGGVTYAFTLHATEAGLYEVVGTGETSGLAATTQFDPVNVTIANSGLTFYKFGADIVLSGTYQCSGGGGAPNCTTFVPTNIAVGVYLSNGAPNTTGPTPVGVLSATLTPGSGMSATNSTSGTWTKTFLGGGSSLSDGSKYDVKATFTFTPGTSASPQSAVRDDILQSDKTAPAAPSVAGTTPSSPSSSNALTVNGSAEGGTTVTIYTDPSCSAAAPGSDMTSSGGNFSVPTSVLADSSTTFWARASDLAGNSSGCSATSATYVEDSTVAAPILLSSTPPSPNQNTAPLINGTAEVGATVALYKNNTCTGSHDDGIAVGGSFAIAVTVSNNSTTTFWGKATDLAANVSSCSGTSVTYNADNNPPSVSLNTFPSNPTALTSANFTFTATDSGANASGIASVQCRLDSPTWGACASNSSFTAVVGAGSHTFAVRATDNAANTGNETSYAWNVTAGDVTPPDTSIASNPGDPSGSSSASFTFTGADDVTAVGSLTFECKLDAGSFAACISAQSYSSLGEGPHIFSVRAKDAAGNVDASPASFAWTIDVTKPVITALAKNADNTAYAAGTWTHQSVTVSFSCADAGSGLASNTVGGGGTLTTETSTGTFTSTGSCTDNAGNSSNPVSFSPIQIDKTPPVISGSAAPGANGAGWNNTDVTVSFTCADELGGSGIDGNTVAGATVSTEGSGQSVTNSGACTDKAGNTADSAMVSGINIDKTKPVISGSATPAANTHDWNNTAVTVSFSCDDGLSGIATDTVAGGTLGSEGANQSKTNTGACTDKAGNTADSAMVSGISIDLTKPVIAGSRLPLANGFGWNNTDVTVSFSCTDALSGTDANTVAGATVSAEGSDQSVTNSGACTDMAGNTANPATVSGINIDKTPPTAFDFIGGGLSDGGSYYFGSVPLGPTSCSANGSISGLNGTCSVSGYSTTVGSQTVTATATDKAGNTGHAHISYSVLAWTLLGFYQPVNMIQNYVNTVKNGSTVPLKFEIFAGQTELTSTADVKSFALASVSCLAFDGQVTDPVDFTTTGGTTLRYDTTAGQFIQNWQTPKKPNTCWVVTMTAQDGSTIVSDFQLK